MTTLDKYFTQTFLIRLSLTEMNNYPKFIQESITKVAFKEVLSLLQRTLPKQIALILLLFITTYSVAQNEREMELRAELKEVKDDPNRIVLMFKLTKVVGFRNIDSALAIIDDVLEVRSRCNFSGYDYSFLVLRSEYLVNKGDFVEAHRNNMFHLRLAESQGNNTQVAVALLRFGTSHYKQGEKEKALFYIEKSMATDSINPTAYLMNLTRLHFLKDNLDSALLYSKIVLPRLDVPQNSEPKFHLEFNQSNRKLNVLQKIGELHLKRGELDSAEKYMQWSLDLAESSDHVKLMTRNYRTLGLIYKKQKKPLLAVKAIKKSLYYGRKLNSKIELLESYTPLSNIYQLMGNYELSKLYQDSATTLKDTMLTIEKARQIEELNVLYESEKKDRTIAELEAVKTRSELEAAQKDKWLLITLGSITFLILVIIFFSIWNRQRKKQRESEFAKKSAELEGLVLRAQMNPHFTFNALNSIKILINEKKSDEAEYYISTYADLLRSQLANTESKFATIEEELETLSLYLELEQLRLDKKITFNLEVDPELDEEFDKIPAMILQPIVENCVKHGFTKEIDKPAISLSLLKEGEGVKCTILDNGIGLQQTEDKNKGKLSMGKGTSIIKDRLKFYTQNSDEAFFIRIAENENQTGVLATLRLPLK